MSVSRITPYAVSGVYVTSLSSPAVNVPDKALLVSGLFGQGSPGTVSVTDNAGNTWAVLTVLSGTHGVEYLAYCLSANANAATVVTWHCTTSQIISIAGCAYSDSAGGTWSFDQAKSNQSAYATAAKVTFTSTPGAGVIAGIAAEYYSDTEVFTNTGVAQQAFVNGSGTTYAVAAEFVDIITTGAQSNFAPTVIDNEGGYGGYISLYLGSFLLTASGGGGGSSTTLAGSVASQPAILGGLQASQSLSASPAAAPIAQGAAVARMVMAGAATIYPFAGGQFRQVNAALALASVSPAIEGLAQGRQQAAGSSVAQPVVQSVAQAFQRLAAMVSLQPAISGSFTIHSSAVSLTGAITVQPSVSASMSARQGFAGTILLQPEVSGVLTISQPGTVSLVGAIAVQPGMIGYLSARQSAAGSVTAPARAAGSFTGINALSGSATALPSVAGAWLGFLQLATGVPAPYAARGTAYAWQPLQGDVILQPAVAGAIHPPFVGYPVDPHFYVLQPARVFYAKAPARSFYVAMAPRTFYVLDEPTMTAQIFPGVLDPAETQVLTIDATALLPAGVTLTSIVGAPVVAVVHGLDANAANVFSGAAINTAPIAADPPDIPVAIGANLAVQLVATNPADGVQYEVRIPCQTSRANKVVTLKAIIGSTAS